MFVKENLGVAVNVWDTVGVVVGEDVWVWEMVYVLVAEYTGLFV